MSPRRRKWIFRLAVALVLASTAGGAWAWMASPGHKVRVLMDRLYDRQPNIVQQLLIKIGIAKPRKPLSGDCVVAEIILIGRPAVPHAIEYLKDPRKEVRLVAVDAMGELAQGDEFDSVLPLLRDGDGEVKNAAIRVLGHARHRPAVEPLIQMLKEKKDKGMSWPVVTALMEIGDRRAAGPLIEWLAPRMETEGGSESEYDPKTSFLFCNRQALPLAKLGGPELTDFFIVCLKHKSVYVRIASAEALGEIGDSTAVTPLMEALGDEKAEVRSKAIESLGVIGDNRAAEPLAAFLADKSSRIRLDAAAGLYRIGDQRGRAALLAAEEGHDLDARKYARSRLAILGDGAVLAPLLSSMSDAGDNERWVSASNLGTLGDPRAVDLLVKGLADPDGNVRCMSAHSLGRLGERRAVGPLVDATASLDPKLRGNAATSLGELGDPIAVRSLVVLIDDKDNCVAQCAVLALDAIRAHEAVGPLKRRLRELEGACPKSWEPWMAAQTRMSIARAIRHIEDGKPPDPPRVPARRKPLATAPSTAPNSAPNTAPKTFR